MIAATQRALAEELEEIATNSDGVLQAEAVHEWARIHPDSTLHGRLQWDDELAGHDFRIWQIRFIIRTVTVVANTGPNAEPIRAFVSLMDDRRLPGGGYRQTITVLSDEALRAALVKQALSEFRYWQQKYKALKELAEIFSAADRAAELI